MVFASGLEVKTSRSIEKVQQTVQVSRGHSAEDEEGEAADKKTGPKSSNQETVKAGY